MPWRSSGSVWQGANGEQGKGDRMERVLCLETDYFWVIGKRITPTEWPNQRRRKNESATVKDDLYDWLGFFSGGFHDP
jgi:hypothetical protein